MSVPVIKSPTELGNNSESRFLGGKNATPWKPIWRWPWKFPKRNQTLEVDSAHDSLVTLTLAFIRTLLFKCWNASAAAGLPVVHRQMWLFFRRELKPKGTLNARWFFSESPNSPTALNVPQRPEKTGVDRQPSRSPYAGPSAALRVDGRDGPAAEDAEARRDCSSAGARPLVSWAAEQARWMQFSKEALDVSVGSINQTRSACFLSFVVLATMVCLSCTFSLRQDVVSSGGGPSWSDLFSCFFFFFPPLTRLDQNYWTKKGQNSSFHFPAEIIWVVAR